MAEERLISLMGAIEQVGVWLSVLAWFSLVAGTIGMGSFLRLKTDPPFLLASDR